MPHVYSDMSSHAIARLLQKCQPGQTEHLPDPQAGRGLHRGLRYALHGCAQLCTNVADGIQDQSGQQLQVILHVFTQSQYRVVN